MAGLILVRNVVGELRPKRTLAAWRGFLAAARLSCFVLVSWARLRWLHSVFQVTLNSRIMELSSLRIFLVCIYNRKFPAVKQSVFLLDQKFSKMWQGLKVLWNKTMGRKFHPMELSSPGTKVPDTKLSPYRIVVKKRQSTVRWHRNGIALHNACIWDVN